MCVNCGACVLNVSLPAPLADRTESRGGEATCQEHTYIGPAPWQKCAEVIWWVSVGPGYLLERAGTV